MWTPPTAPQKKTKTKKTPWYKNRVKDVYYKSSRCLLKLEYWITYDNYRSIYTSQNPEE